ncbi:MAG: hypothetical protein ICV83_33585 [Cytophagales bacterium]|nr:hypothetical protein [Cytophagales bacterium]
MWRSDGTKAGTMRLSDIDTGAGSQRFRFVKQ